MRYTSNSSTYLSTIKRLLLLCLITFTVIRYNQTLHNIKNDVSSSQKLSKQQHTIANHTYTKQKNRLVVDLTLHNATNLSLNDSISETPNYFFDCNNSISKCTYFYPSKFYKYYFVTFVLNNDNTARHNDTSDTSYNAYNGIDDIEELYSKWRKEIGFENANLPALDSLSYWSATDQNEHMNGKAEKSMQYTAAIQDYMSLPRNITYIHVHKCGGTSIQGAMYKRARLIRNTDIHIHSQHDNNESSRILNMKAEVQTYKHSYGGGTKEKKLIWDAKRLAHIDSIAQSQSSLSRRDHSIFTVVRNPISRFLSALQQVMHYNVDFREKCLFEPSSVSSSTLSLITNKLINTVSSQQSEEKEELKLKRLRQQTIQCAIQDMMSTNYRKDVHLLPIISHFRLLDDVAVSVFNMNDIQHVLSYLVGNTNQQEEDNSTSTKVYHARDRSNVDYATSSILAQLSIDDCTDEMIQQICKLYHVDVKLMKWLGFSNDERALCFIPRALPIPT